MRIKMIAVGLGFLAVLAGISSSICLGAVFLDENSMGLVRGGTPVRWLCSEGAQCNKPPCNPFLGLWCTGGGCRRGTSINWSKVCESYPMGAVNCSSPKVSYWCGDARKDSMCTQDFTCQGGEPYDPPIGCDGYHCTTSN